MHLAFRAPVDLIAPGEQLMAHLEKRVPRKQTAEKLFEKISILYLKMRVKQNRVAVPEAGARRALSYRITSDTE